MQITKKSIDILLSKPKQKNEDLYFTSFHLVARGLQRRNELAGWLARINNQQFPPEGVTPEMLCEMHICKACACVENKKEAKQEDIAFLASNENTDTHTHWNMFQPYN